MTSTQSRNFLLPLQVLLGLFITLAIHVFTACSNSEPASFDIEETDSIHCRDTNIVVSPSQKDTSPDLDSIVEIHEFACDTTKEYLPLDDTDYPYAGIPRIVIETKKHREIKDRETEIPAKLQIWGENAPESGIMELTIRGRGNTSWDEMPKKSYKIEFINKQTMLGMPKDRDWALIANYADKTLMKNYLAYHLAAEFGVYYSPKCEFAEIYLNGDYLGVYLLTETIKISPDRIQLPKNSNSYIVEIDGHIRKGEQFVTSNILSTNNKIFRIHFPKKANEEELAIIKNHIYSFETFLSEIKDSDSTNIEQWIDKEEYIKYYWIQEFIKNTDAAFFTSVYFSWERNSVIKMGPIWDFDLSLGGHPNEQGNSPYGWCIKYSYWNKYLFKDTVFSASIKNFWQANGIQFNSIFNYIDSMALILSKAASNNFKRWNILQSTESRFHKKSFNNYIEAINVTKDWIYERKKWIDIHYKEL